MLTVGSLFSGIGGLELGLARAGMRTVWQVERDHYARRVLERRWPYLPRWDDVLTFPPEPADRWACDLICGGFPCQDISKAGNVQGERMGLDGERSGLWGEFLRIVRRLRPAFVLVENVARLLVRGLDRVLGDLATLGYDAEWHCLPAALFGAPHIRDRLFIFAYSLGGRIRLSGRSPFAGAETPLQGKAQKWDRLWTHPGTVGPLDGVAGYPEHLPWHAEPNVGRVADGVPDALDRLQCLGNAVVPQVAEWIGRRIIESLKGN
jgi:DNA (cytosine-5)-methyltransferase 1